MTISEELEQELREIEAMLEGVDAGLLNGRLKAGIGVSAFERECIGRMLKTFPRLLALLEAR